MGRSGDASAELLSRTFHLPAVLAEETEADGWEQKHREHAGSHQGGGVFRPHATPGLADGSDDHNERKARRREEGKDDAFSLREDPTVEHKSGDAPGDHFRARNMTRRRSAFGRLSSM